MNALLRLLRYAAPYRLRLIWAIAAMLVYAAASALLPLQIKVILDSVLPRQEQVGQAAVVVVLAYLFKGLGGYFSNYLMADVGQRVVRDLRNRLHSHMLEQSAGFFARRSTGQLLSRITNDVGQVQHVVAETIGDLLQEGLALVGYAGLLFWYDARLALVCVTGAPIIVYPLAKLGRRLRQDHPPQSGSARAPVPRRGRIVCRPSDRQGVWRGTSRGGAVFRGLVAAVPHEHDGHVDRLDSAAADGVAGRLRHCRRAVLRQPRDRGGPAHAPASSRRSSRRCC